MNFSTADGVMISLSLLVLLGLSTAPIGMLWDRAKAFFNEFFEG